jgi:hypothetical protein
LGRRWEYLRNTGRSIATVNKDTLDWFDRQWQEPSLRLNIIPGKVVLAALRERVKTQCGVSLTDARIFDAFRKEDIPLDLVRLVDALEHFKL